MSSPFGTPGSIDPRKLPSLPAAMRREAALMLLDMGFSEAAAGRHLRLTASTFDQLVRNAPAPFQRGGEQTLAGDNQ